MPVQRPVVQLVSCTQLSVARTLRFNGQGGHLLDCRTPLHVFGGGFVNGVRYRDEVLEPYVHIFRGACGPVLIKEFLESEDIRKSGVQRPEIQIGLKSKADFPGVRREKRMNTRGVVEINQPTSKKYEEVSYGKAVCVQKETG
ncbi:hypothetical protein TNCV_1754441 [Trichonephila clavipes]|nr:hypothetical protein TNCV_1754441 [Trichonephila clavipes]